MTHAHGAALGAHDHSHGHGHAHGHAHGGAHAGGGLHGPLARALTLTVIIAVAEVLGGIFSNSLALLADAGHMVTDVAALGLALFAAWLQRRPAVPGQTFGARRWEILAAWINGAALVAISAGILWEAIGRFRHPPPVQATVVLVIAIVGLGTNGLSAYWLHGASQESLNARGAYLHVLGDLAGSLATIIAAVLMLTLQWTLADPIASVAVSLLVLASAGRLMRDATDVLLEATPPHIDLAKVRSIIAALPSVESVHDLHVWTVGGGMVAMSAHAVVTGGDGGQSVLSEARVALQRMGIGHVTIQIERPALDDCEGCV